MLELFTPEILASLATLTILEIVLGIDNIIFISIVASRLPKAQQPLARKLGLIGALVIRLLFLTLVAFKRAGCDGVWSYFAPEAAKLLKGIKD